MGAVLQFTTSLESAGPCYSCGVEHAMPANLLRRFKEEQPPPTFYCPNGHPQSYSKSEVRRLQEQIAAKEKDLAFQKSQREAETRRAEAATARALKSERKLQRVKGGVCPCCKRSFTALRRHMATKHPDWKP